MEIAQDITQLPIGIKTPLNGEGGQELVGDHTLDYFLDTYMRHEERMHMMQQFLDAEEEAIEQGLGGEGAGDRYKEMQRIAAYLSGLPLGLISITEDNMHEVEESVNFARYILDDHLVLRDMVEVVRKVAAGDPLSGDSEGGDKDRLAKGIERLKLLREQKEGILQTHRMPEFKQMLADIVKGNRDAEHPEHDLIHDFEKVVGRGAEIPTDGNLAEEVNIESVVGQQRLKAEIKLVDSALDKLEELGRKLGIDRQIE